jgi:hypothetical protein
MDSTHRATWDLYAASWKAGGSPEKRALFEQCLAPDCVYTDPLVRAEGWKALEAYMVEFHRQVPGGAFVTQDFLSHHDASIAVWTMVNGAGDPIGDGMSCGEYDDSGKLIRMTGFFDVPGTTP